MEGKIERKINNKVQDIRGMIEEEMWCKDENRRKEKGW